MFFGRFVTTFLPSQILNAVSKITFRYAYKLVEQKKKEKNCAQIKFTIQLFNLRHEYT